MAAVQHVKRIANPFRPFIVRCTDAVMNLSKQPRGPDFVSSLQCIIVFAHWYQWEHGLPFTLCVIQLNKKHCAFPSSLTLVLRVGPMGIISNPQWHYFLLSRCAATSTTISRYSKIPWMCNWKKGMMNPSFFQTGRMKGGLACLHASTRDAHRRKNKL